MIMLLYYHYIMTLKNVCTSRCQSNYLQLLSNTLWLRVAPPFPLHVALQRKDIMYNHKSSMFEHICGTYIYFSNFSR